MSTPEDVAARLRQLEPTVRYFCSETDADLMVELGNLITDQRATIERLRTALLLVQRTDRESIAELRPFMGDDWQPDRAVMDVVDAALEGK